MNKRRSGIKQPKKTLSKDQLSKQVKMLYDLMMETRQVVMNLTQRYEEMKLRMMSEWETQVQLFSKENGTLEEDIESLLKENFDRNLEKYNKIIEERMDEYQKQAEKQADEITKQAEEYLKKEGIEIPEVTEGDIEAEKKIIELEAQAVAPAALPESTEDLEGN